MPHAAILADTGFAATLSSVFFYCAVLGGGILLLQIVFMLVGVDDGGLGDLADAGGVDIGDVDTDGATDSAGYWFYELISLRTLSAAAALFGVVGRVSLEAGNSAAASLALGGVAGYSAMYAVYWLFKQVFKLEASGTFDIRNAVNAVGEVYVPIDPATAGKIQVTVQGRTVELQARSDHNDRLPTGSKVTVTEIISGDTVRVTPAG